MDITNTTNTAATGQTTAASTAGATKSMGETDFLKLLTTQLQAQDPLNPMDATGFTAQLAQFSSLEQLTSINTNLANLLSSQTSLQTAMATDLIGKKVGVSGGNTVTLNGQAAMNYSLSGDASKVSISIFDANGKQVNTVNLGQQAAGSNSFTWDGKDANGNTLPSGQYTFDVTAADSAGQAVTATPTTTGMVTGVIFQNNTTYLSIDGTTNVKLSDINEIYS